MFPPLPTVNRCSCSSAKMGEDDVDTYQHASGDPQPHGDLLVQAALGSPSPATLAIEPVRQSASRKVFGHQPARGGGLDHRACISSSFFAVMHHPAYRGCWITAINFLLGLNCRLCTDYSVHDRFFPGLVPQDCQTQTDAFSNTHPSDAGTQAASNPGHPPGASRSANRCQSRATKVTTE